MHFPPGCFSLTFIILLKIVCGISLDIPNALRNWFDPIQSRPSSYFRSGYRQTLRHLPRVNTINPAEQRTQVGTDHNTIVASVGCYACLSIQRYLVDQEDARRFISSEVRVCPRDDALFASVLL